LFHFKYQLPFLSNGFLFRVGDDLTRKQRFRTFLSDPITLFVTKLSRANGSDVVDVEPIGGTDFYPLGPQSRGVTAMSLAQRVRDIRYAKGWGPDELANRAEISRTALYQIESGKTGLPRAGTLRRIAVALEVPMDDLLGNEGSSEHGPASPDRPALPRRPHGLYDWIPSEGGPLTIAPTGSFKTMSVASSDESRFTVDSSVPNKANGYDSIFVREGELMAKLHDLLHSPLGDGVARIVEELHTLLPRTRGSV
jgi:transcriptional regulator with XRE-family HTH domain